MLGYCLLIQAPISASKEIYVLMVIPAEYDGDVSSMIWNYYTSILTTPHTYPPCWCSPGDIILTIPGDTLQEFIIETRCSRRSNTSDIQFN